MTSLFDLSTQYGIPAHQDGFSDLIALIRDAPRETAINAVAGQVRARDMLSVDSFALEAKQPSAADNRLAGEGADPNTFQVQLATFQAHFTMPLLGPIIGWVEPAFADLWDLTRLAHWGTASAAVGGVVYSDATLPAGEIELTTDNVAEFAALPVPYEAILATPDGMTEAVQVVEVKKRERTLLLAAPTLYAHATETTQIVVRPDYCHGPEREPSFSLLSLREGLLSPCLVNRLTIEADATREVEIQVDLSGLGLYRDRQIALRAARETLLAQFASQMPTHAMEGQNVRLLPATARNGDFGLASALGHPLFGGYQGWSLPDFVVTGISITIDNRLKEVHTLHSRKQGGTRQRENAFPFALYSEGRQVTGKIRYRAPLEPWVVAERLSGPSSLANGGLIIDYGNCRIPLTEIAWSPSSGDQKADGTQERTLEFALLAEGRDAMPRLEYSSRE